MNYCFHCVFELAFRIMERNIFFLFFLFNVISCPSRSGGLKCDTSLGDEFLNKNSMEQTETLRFCAPAELAFWRLGKHLDVMVLEYLSGLKGELILFKGFCDSINL